MELVHEPTSDWVRLRWGGDDGDGIGELTVSAWSNGFAGRSEAWFDSETVVDFAHAVRAYPLPDEQISVSGGLAAEETHPSKEHVGIRVGRVGLWGQIGMRIHLATPVWPNSDPDSRHEVSLSMLTTYERLRTFGDHLVRLVGGELDEVELRGEVLA